MKRILRAFLIINLLWAVHGLAYDKDVVNDTIVAQQSQAGMKEQKFEQNGQTLFYLDNQRNDAKRTIVLVHGFGDSGLSWLFFARIFRDADYRIIIPDLMGFGRSDRPENADYSYDAQAQRLLNLLASLDIKKADVVGNSMGGGVVARMALLAPDRIATLTLMDAAGVHYKPTELDHILLSGRNPLLMNKPDDFDALLGFAAFQRPLITRPIVEYLGERAVKDRVLHERIFNDVLFEGLNLLLPDLPRIKMPTLILWGAKDRVLSPENGKIFQQYIPGSRLQIFENVGHLPMVEIPELSAVAVLQFIASFGTTEGNEIIKN